MATKPPPLVVGLTIRLVPPMMRLICRYIELDGIAATCRSCTSTTEEFSARLASWRNWLWKTAMFSWVKLAKLPSAVALQKLGLEAFPPGLHSSLENFTTTEADPTPGDVVATISVSDCTTCEGGNDNPIAISLFMLLLPEASKNCPLTVRLLPPAMGPKQGTTEKTRGMGTTWRSSCLRLQLLVPSSRNCTRSLVLPWALNLERMVRVPFQSIEGN
mmetsp:Transcript_21259/g.47959  ORF Transcript_21259/g.47959 Transcript_21259/m.47959 type:complete len:217 (-) Transcript_21259:990-1640(-)